MRKILFYDLTPEENVELLKGVHIIKVPYDPNVPYFNAFDTITIIDRAIEKGFVIHGIECWSSVDFEYFEAYAMDCYAERFNVPKKHWALYAVFRLIRDYNEIILSKEPDNLPIFNLTISKDEENGKE